MKHLILFGVLLCIAIATTTAATVRGRVMLPDNSPASFANVYWENTTLGVATDDKGEFEIETTPLSNRLVTSFLGSINDTTTLKNPTAEVVIHLREDAKVLGDVTVTERRIGTIHSRISTLQTQEITSAELCRAACCNLAESFETNASVDVTYSDAATGARQIRLLGLSGTYVQMLSEQTPSLRGAASLFGMEYVPGTWMESIQVSKGNSSVKNGYEAITGQINIEYKKPQTAAPLSVNLFGASSGRMEANVDGALMLNKYLGTGLLLHYSREKMEMDDNGDGFMDLPTTEQMNLMNRWYYRRGDYVGQVAVNLIHERRESGQLRTLENPYRIGITTRRGSAFLKNGYILNDENNESVALILSGALHDQVSSFGNTPYNILQKNLYANLLYEITPWRGHHFSAGASFNLDRYDELYGIRRSVLNEYIPGLFAQYTYSLADKLTVMAGIRGDYHNRYGFFATPRLHLKYSPTSWLTARLSAGKGYRTALPLVENNFLLAGNRKIIISDSLDPQESAWNYGASLQSNIEIADKNLSINLEWYYTRFEKQVVTDMENPREASFYNLQGRSYAQNIQLEASYPFFRGFTLTAAMRLTDAKTTYNGILREKPLTNRYKALVTASYATKLKKWQFDLTSSFNGGGRMPTPDATNPLWEQEFPAFVLLNAQVTRNFRDWSIYAGGENLTNYKQKNPIIDAANPWDENGHFDSSMIYGPVHGVKIYIGVRWTLPQKI